MNYQCSQNPAWHLTITAGRDETLRHELLELAKGAPAKADVLDEEPPRADHPLTKLANCVVTPHIGSRTAESVQRQAVAAVTNLIRAMHGEKPLAQINPEVPVKKVV